MSRQKASSTSRSTKNTRASTMTTSSSTIFTSSQLSDAIPLKKTPIPFRATALRRKCSQWLQDSETSPTAGKLKLISRSSLSKRTGSPDQSHSKASRFLKEFYFAESQSWSDLSSVPSPKTQKMSNKFRRESDKENASLTKEDISF